VSATPSPLDQPLTALCVEFRLTNPACKSPKEASPAYKWLLLDDVCEHEGKAGRSPACQAFASFKAGTEPCVVAYDHRAGEWRALHALQARQKWAFDTDASGVPTLAVDRSNSCATMIDNTKPLTYGVQIGKIEEKDNDFSGGLKDLAELLGATAAASAPILQRLDVDRSTKLDEFDQLRLQSWLLAVKLQPLADVRSDIATALNVAESSETGSLTPVRWDLVGFDGATWRSWFEQLRIARNNAQTALGAGVPGDPQRAALEQAQKILDRQGEIARLVTGLGATKDRWDRFVVGDRMLTWVLAPVSGQPVKWTKDLVYSLTVNPDAPFAADVAARRPKVETSVRFTSPRASLVGISAGMIVTPLSERTYKAIEGSDGKKHITAAETETRTGQIALLFDWQIVPLFRPEASTWSLRPALELGAAASTKSPGVFFGGSMAILKWLRLSYGRTWQRVTVLNGQTLNAEVADSDAIKTKDVFKGARYWSVSVSISGLPIFTNK
jgi:hypothetical protein